MGQKDQKDTNPPKSAGLDGFGHICPLRGFWVFFAPAWVGEVGWLGCAKWCGLGEDAEKFCLLRFHVETAKRDLLGKVDECLESLAKPPKNPSLLNNQEENQTNKEKKPTNPNKKQQTNQQLTPTKALYNFSCLKESKWDSKQIHRSVSSKPVGVAARIRPFLWSW